MRDHQSETNQGIPPPSIKSRRIRVPLIFWFNRNPSLALPLIALQYDPVQIDITCRKITDLYTVKDIEPSSSSFGSIIKPILRVLCIEPRRVMYLLV